MAASMTGYGRGEKICAAKTSRGIKRLTIGILSFLPASPAATDIWKTG
jgi:hypothetical protein